MTGPARYVLDRLEVATGLVLGVGPELEIVGRTRLSEPPLRALERAVLPSLQRPPCVVSFSGGRDSSVVLAVAAAVARKEGLPLPIPATNRFPSAAATDESEWQERIVAHLALDEWIRLEHHDELDCVGPVATDALRRHGLLWPFNAYFHVPLLQLASSGSLLTGVGGDELMSPSRWSRALDVLHGRQRPQLLDVFRIGLAFAPPALRSRILRRRLPVQYAWLRQQARRAFAQTWAAQAAGDPRGWNAHFAWVRRLRYLQVGAASLRRLAADEDVSVGHPFLDAGFGAALANLPPGERFGTRGEAMQALFGGLLPEAVLARPVKTVFDEVFWNEASRTFAARWNGEGIDEEIVDREALAAEWARSAPDPRSFLLLQAAWLARHERSADRVEQALDGVRQ
jgi:asparagine synthase